MSAYFEKWDIIYTAKFPESVQCQVCRNYVMPCVSKCNCGHENNISNIVNKIRPVLLWIDKLNWFESMAFAIPLSTTNSMLENKFNEPIEIKDFNFIHTNKDYFRPMRAMIHQSTRIDGNALPSNEIIGKVTDNVKKEKIENKLFSWIFGGSD
jgi:hypothetical protein